VTRMPCRGGEMKNSRDPSGGCIRLSELIHSRGRNFILSVGYQANPDQINLAGRRSVNTRRVASVLTMLVGPQPGGIAGV